MICTWQRFIDESECLNKAEQAKDKNIDYFVNDYFCKNYIGTPLKNGNRSRPRFAIALWNVHDSTIQGYYPNKTYIIYVLSFFTINFCISDEQRTNNICEGWHHAFSSMNGVNKPTIWRFIDALKKDEDITRTKIISCNSELPAPPQKRKDAEINAAIKNIVLTYVKKTEADNENNSGDEEEENESNEDAAAGGEETKSSRDKWLKTPEMTLLSAIANISRI